MISYIVSVYDRPHLLNVCLASLGVQKHQTDTTVCANHHDAGMLLACGLTCEANEVPMIKTGLAGAVECYDSANMVAPKTKGEWLCFPSDDSIYVKDFSEIMLDTAEREKADLVYCDCIYKRGQQAIDSANPWKDHTALNVQPRMGRIDKICFILRRELFKGFPPHPRNWRDGALIEQLVKDGVRHAKAPGILVVHQ